MPRELTQEHKHYVQSFLQSHAKVRRLEDRNVLSVRRSTGESFSFLGTIAKLNFPDGLRLAIIMRELTDYLRKEARSLKQAPGELKTGADTKP